MTREEAKEWLPIIQAWAEGKTIQYQFNPGSRWTDIINDLYTSNPPSNYRIKPELKYRPFKTKEECWTEMLKHQPFGYLTYKEDNSIIFITEIYTANINEGLYFRLSRSSQSYEPSYLFKSYTFADGTPFGINEE